VSWAATALSRPWALAAGLTIVLIIVNTLVQPQFAAPQYVAGNLDLFAPLALAAVASTPSILAGGIDVSIGPLLGLVNILVVSPVLPPALQGPLMTPLACLAVGAGVGIVNGLIVAVVRIQPVVATIGAYLILAGLDVKLLPIPAGPAPDWAVQLQAGIGPIPGSLLLMAAPVVVWAALRAIPYHKALLAVGGDEPAAFSTGMNTAVVKVIAYGLGGLFAAVAGIALSSGLSAADAALGPQYTVVAIAAVALGGTSLAGGKGGLTEAFLGALVIFLIESLLAALGLTSLWLPLIYGSILVVSLIIGSRLTTGAGMRRGGA
jgi:ribose transport system permease protein